MGARQLLPDRIRVVVNAVRQDLRNVRLAVTAERRPSFSARSTPPAEVPERRKRPKLPDGPPDRSEIIPSDEEKTPNSAPEQAIAVFAESGIEVVVEPGQTILQAGLEAGVDLIFSCGLGGCGACMLTCVEGEVEYDDVDATCLLKQDIEGGLCLACVGRPRGRVVLDA